MAPGLSLSPAQGPQGITIPGWGRRRISGFAPSQNANSTGCSMLGVGSQPPPHNKNIQVYFFPGPEKKMRPPEQKVQGPRRPEADTWGPRQFGPIDPGLFGDIEAEGRQ